MAKLNSLQNWDYIYRKGKQLTKWPWSDMIGLVRRYADVKRKTPSVLELGCGAGANIPFFLSLGYNYYGIDGSTYIVKKLKKKYPQLKKQLVQSDFTQKIPFKQKFDLIVDRAAITHNSSEAIKGALNLILSKLKPDGTFIGIDWFSTKHSDYHKSESIKGDIYSQINHKSGQFTEVGMVSFFNKKRLLGLFKNFKIKYLSHKIVKYEIPAGSKHQILATWNLVAAKRHQ